MDEQMNRRQFLISLPLATGAVAQVAGGAEVSRSGGVAADMPLEAFDYHGVRLLPSHWQRQYQAARDFFFNLPNDDILHGYRAQAGLPAPGQRLKGWGTGETIGSVFGQWLSGMSRMYRATGDAAMRDKAVYLFSEWAKTRPADGNSGSGHYGFDKLVCGLVDLQLYADHQDAGVVLERLTDQAIRTLTRENRLFDRTHYRDYGGYPWEWYTLSENLYRAYVLTGDPKFRDFGEVWRYTEFWNQFANTAEPPDAHGGHAYSHVNTFSSAAMAYEVTGDETYLRIIKNAYDYLQNTQCFATGGYGPQERLLALDGSLGRALDTRANTTEIGCGSWAGFKLGRYLIRATGEARYGDWIERLLYNGVGAALPMGPGGLTFYYADYRMGGGSKVYSRSVFPCCTGTYIQSMADYHNIIYFKDSSGLYVNLFVPSEVTWSGAAGEVRLRQETRYPEEDTTTLTLSLRGPTAFPLHFRVPGWTRDVSVRVNGAAVAVQATPGTWATVSRTWNTGDRVEIRIPLVTRMEAVDRHHPDRVAVLRGPVVLALEAQRHDPVFRLPHSDDELERWLVPVAEEASHTPLDLNDPLIPRLTLYRADPPGQGPVNLRRSLFRPYYQIPASFQYFVYFDRNELPYALW